MTTSTWAEDHYASMDVEWSWPADCDLGDADEMLDEILGYERRIAAPQAEQLRAIARFAELRPDRLGGPVDEFAADELAPLLRMSRNAAHARLALAVQLVTRLPGTLAALERGDIDLYKARIVAEHTEVLTDDQATAVEERILGRCAQQTPGQLRAAVRRAVYVVDPHGAERRRQARLTDRRVQLQAGPDGTASLAAFDLDATDATRAYQRLDAYARAIAAGDTRTTDQRRADALVDLLLGRPATELGNPDVHVTVAADTLLGLDESPAELAGYGPIGAAAAREIAAGGTWRRVLTDPASGALVEVGRDTYRPPAALADHVRARDRTCRFPGCRQPARRCDLDHGVPFPEGPTDEANLATLCRHHHRLKHERDWSVGTSGNGALTWTSPTGRRYVTEPEPVADPADRPPTGTTGSTGSTDATGTTRDNGG